MTSSRAPPFVACKAVHMVCPTCGHSWWTGTLPMSDHEAARVIAAPCPNCRCTKTGGRVFALQPLPPLKKPKGLE